MGGYEYGLPKQHEWQPQLGPFCTLHDNCNTQLCNTLCAEQFPSLLLNNPSYTFLDSGTPEDYINNNTLCFDKLRTKNGPVVTLPNNEKIAATHRASLYLPKEYLKHAYIQTPLLSIGQLYKW